MYMRQLGYGTKQFTSHFNISSTNERREKINVWKSLPTIPLVENPRCFTYVSISTIVDFFSNIPMKNGENVILVISNNSTIYGWPWIAFINTIKI